jgi:hypothetical protein
LVTIRSDVLSGRYYNVGPIGRQFTSETQNDTVTKEREREREISSQ